MEIHLVMFLSVKQIRETEGSKPMSIKWELNEPYPIICGKNLQNVNRIIKKTLT
jgi:hypothetical protein